MTKKEIVRQIREELSAITGLANALGESEGLLGRTAALEWVLEMLEPKKGKKR